MRIAFYTDCLSPHQMPIARALACNVGPENFLYIYFTDHYSAERVRLGWRCDGGESWTRYYADNLKECLDWINNADLLISGSRDDEMLSLYESRDRRGLVTFYQSERWFKPFVGMMRLLHPIFLKKAFRMYKLLSEHHRFYYLPYGVHAGRDMAKLCSVFGSHQSLARRPACGWRPGDRCLTEDSSLATKFRLWGYFVAPSTLGIAQRNDNNSSTLKILWVGRFLRLKRIDTLVRAVYDFASRKDVSLTIVGSGPDNARLERLIGYLDRRARGKRIVHFSEPVPIYRVRELMRVNDVYVMASDGREGWGCVSNEALEEGMVLIGSKEAGSSATMLPEHCLFGSGDWRALSKILRECDSRVSQGIGCWNAEFAARKILDLYEEIVNSERMR